MVTYALIGAPAEASGHPSACSEPAPGTIEGDSTVTYNGTPIANADTTTIEFGSHGHSTDADGNCTDYTSHSLVPETVSETVTYNGEGFFLTQDSVDTDPGSGGAVDITASGGNDTVSE